jgi:glucosylceramidase
MLGQYSKFVERGAYRIETSQDHRDRNLTEIAFLNPDGTVVLVLINEAKQDKVVGCNLVDYHFSARIPEKTVATFRIQP